MEGDEISVVLSRVSELRSKIINSITDKTTKRLTQDRDESQEEDEEGESSLFSIRDALESLEEVLSSLQALQQQQRYEREATLAEIDHSRKILLKKIKEYKGGDLEVIHEVSAFASETVEHDDDLLLPPYPTHPHPLILDNGNGYSSKRNFSRNGNGVNVLLPINNKLEKEQAQTTPPARNAFAGLRFFLSVATKTVVTLVGVVSILSLAGFEPRVRRTTEFKIKIPSSEEKVINTQCPPGKVLVMENGQPRCLVKERVEIPFEPLVATPDVSYGFG